MSEFINEVAARSIEGGEGELWHLGYVGDGWVDIEGISEAIATAIEPHLRRKHRQELLDELIAEANDHLERFPDREWSGADTEHLSYDDLYGDNPVPDALLLVGSEFGHHSIGEKIAKWLHTKEAE